MNNTNQDTTDNLNTTIPEISTPERSPLTAPEVANYILRKFFEDNIEITPLKLQKIVYITYGWYLAITNKRLFEEPIVAWDLGPVIPSIYYFYKGKNRIKDDEYIIINENHDEEYQIFKKNNDITNVIFPFPVESELFNEKTYLLFDKIVQMVYEKYKNLSAFKLVEILHQKGSPWYKIYNRDNKLASGKHRPLLDEDIKQKSLEALRQKFPDIFKSNNK
jgi:uncharacterized phage-associated protein